MTTLQDFIAAYEATDTQDVDAFLAEWSVHLGLSSTPDRPDFPADAFDGSTCPSCGADGSLQYLDNTVRWWNYQGRSDTGELLFDGSFDYGDGDDDHLGCWDCQAEWTVPVGGVTFT